MGQSLSDLLDDARKELREYWEENPKETEPHDRIHEIADGSVPVYTYDILQLAADNIDLATNEPELGPAFDGSPTPVNIIAANIFERIEEACWDEWRRLEAEAEDAPDCAICYDKVYDHQPSVTCQHGGCDEVAHTECLEPDAPELWYCDEHQLQKESDDDDQ